MTDGRPEGWYSDPRGAGSARWWDGRAWTSRVQRDGPPLPVFPRTPTATMGAAPRTTVHVAPDEPRPVPDLEVEPEPIVDGAHTVFGALAFLAGGAALVAALTVPATVTPIVLAATAALGAGLARLRGAASEPVGAAVLVAVLAALLALSFGALAYA